MTSRQCHFAGGLSNKKAESYYWTILFDLETSVQKPDKMVQMKFENGSLTIGILDYTVIKILPTVCLIEKSAINYIYTVTIWIRDKSCIFFTSNFNFPFLLPHRYLCQKYSGCLTRVFLLPSSFPWTDKCLNNLMIIWRDAFFLDPWLQGPVLGDT